MERGHNRLPLGPGRIEALAHAALDAFATRLKAAALADGGALTPEDIEALTATFKAEGASRLTQGSRQAWECCMSDYRRAVHDKERRYPFERILIHQFSHLLAPKGVEPGPHGTLSRRMIPGFLRALDMMIGPEPVAEYERLGRAIVERLQERHGDGFSWHHFYQDPEAQWLANDVLVHIANHFQDMDKRRAWLIGVVDSHLTPIASTTNGGNGNAAPAAWRFGEAEFRDMMQALYADLGRRLEDEDGRRRLVERYGDGAAETLLRLLRNLGQHAPGTAAAAQVATRAACGAETPDPS